MDYQVIRSRRRTMALQIRPDGTVLVRAPLHTADETVEWFIGQHGDWIQRHQARRLAWLQAHPEPTAQQMDQWRSQARQLIPQRVAHWARIMDLAPAGVKITAARSRFGSCSSRGSLCFSLFLMQYPPAAIDYVVVHELAHLLHRNHGPNFYRTVERYLPDWRQRMALLKG